MPIDYLRRELTDLLESGIGHDSKYPNGFSPWQAWMAYNHVLCLVEAAYRLYTNQQTQCVLNTSLQQPIQVADADEVSLVSMPTGFASSASDW